MGAIYCLLSAAAFGLMPVFGKLAYGSGVSVDTLLTVRFGLAGAVLLAAAAVRRSLQHVSVRSLIVPLAMGAIGYAAQAALYFAALTRIDASLVALILYVYPVLVMGGAVAVKREPASRRRTSALVISLGGIGLVVGGAASTGGVDILGAVLALGGAIAYAIYILVGDRVVTGRAPLEVAPLICTGAFGTFLIAGGVRGQIDLGFEFAGWIWLGGLALVSTAGAILLFFAGLSRIGASATSILSTVEPVVSVLGAAAVFGETLSSAQWVGGLVVLASVIIVQWPKRQMATPLESSAPLLSDVERCKAA